MLMVEMSCCRTRPNTVDEDETRRAARGSWDKSGDSNDFAEGGGEPETREKCSTVRAQEELQSTAEL